MIKDTRVRVGVIKKCFLIFLTNSIDFSKSLKLIEPDSSMTKPKSKSQALGFGGTFVVIIDVEEDGVIVDGEGLILDECSVAEPYILLAVI